MTLHGAAQQQLRQLVDQLERLEAEKKAIADDIKEKFSEAKGAGYDVKALKKVLALRKKSTSERSEEQMILDTYLHALGMTPLEQVIAEAAE